MVDLLDRVRDVLGKKWLIPIVFGIGFIFWFFNLCVVGVCAFTIVFVATLILCKDIKPIFAYLFYVPFYITDLAQEMHWGVYIACGVIAVLALIYFIFRQTIFSKTKKKIKKGKMFYGFVLASVAMFIGGAFGNFNIVSSLLFTLVCWVVYLLYFFAINFTENLYDYLFSIFIIGGIAIVIQATYIYLSNAGEEGSFWIGCHGVNTAAIYIALGIVGVFRKGIGNKNDWLYLILVFAFTLTIVLSRCRAVTIITAPLDVLFFVIMVKKSPKRLYILYEIILLVLVAIGIYFMLKSKIDVLIGAMFGKPAMGGRDVLWPWCLTKFTENPIFGYGFMCDEKVPYVRNVIGNMILAHNTILQWLTSTGIVGSICMLFFYIKKYIIAFDNYKKENLYVVVSLIMIALTGMLDQAAAMDFFIFTIPMFLVAICENSQAVEKIEKVKTEK